MHASVVSCLILSIIVITLEVFVYRLTSDKDLRFRYMNNTAAMWLVFMAFTFMMVFVRRNGAAHFTVKLRYSIVPIHVLYLVMLILGFSRDFGAFCSQESYPAIFLF